MVGFAGSPCISQHFSGALLVWHEALPPVQCQASLLGEVEDPPLVGTQGPWVPMPKGSHSEGPMVQDGSQRGKGWVGQSGDLQMVCIHFLGLPLMNSHKPTNWLI